MAFAINVSRRAEKEGAPMQVPSLVANQFANPATIVADKLLAKPFSQAYLAFFALGVSFTHSLWAKLQQ